MYWEVFEHSLAAIHGPAILALAAICMGANSRTDATGGS